MEELCLLGGDVLAPGAVAVVHSDVLICFPQGSKMDSSVWE